MGRLRARERVASTPTTTLRTSVLPSRPASSRPVADAAPSSFRFADLDLLPGAPIQRKCAGCEAEDEPMQAKRAVSEPGDPLEREADRFADAVVGGGAAPLSRGALGGRVGARAGGEPLEPAVQRVMSERSGFDFAHVRIHADGAAASSAARLAARAYTVGGDIYFDRGQYQPHSRDGQKLIAHELAHVVQQGSGLASGTVQRQGHGSGKQQQPPPVVTKIVVTQVAGGTGGQAVAYAGDKVVRTMKITSGRPSHPTPAGDSFTLGEADKNHHSSVYGDCIGAHGAKRKCTSHELHKGEHFEGTAMPNFRRFNGAIGFHQGPLSVPSHGCIHLSAIDSAWVFALPKGVRVEVQPAPHKHAPAHHAPAHHATHHGTHHP